MIISVRRRCLYKFRGVSKKWSSFQAWIKKWNKIMAVIFSALAITLLLSTVIVNLLEVHEENQEILKIQRPRFNTFEICRRIQNNSCMLYCDAGTSTDISMELNLHWETNSHCQSKGMSVEISSSVQFPKFTIRADWLYGNFTLKELQIDLENVFVICENAFTTEVFKSMKKLVFLNLHVHTMDSQLLQKFFVEQHYKHISIVKKSYSEQFVSITEDLYYDSVFYVESDHRQKELDETIWFGDINQPLIIGLTIVGCILSFTLGLLIRYNLFTQKLFWNQMKTTDRPIFVVEKGSSSFDIQNENGVSEEVNAKNIISK